METCVDLCCNMDVCGVAFRNKDDCFGIECNSDESCESVPADAKDIKVEIAHVRAGKRSGQHHKHALLLVVGQTFDSARFAI